LTLISGTHAQGNSGWHCLCCMGRSGHSAGGADWLALSGLICLR